MSGPYDVPDDPEDVTLWAGRLRPWPALQSPSDDTADAVDEETAVSVRSTGIDDTVRVAREEPSDDTVRVAPREPSDDTVRVVRAESPVETVVPGREEPADDTVRVTREESPVVPGRDGPAEPVIADDPNEETIRVSRHPVSRDAAIPTVDETTAPGRRRAPARSDEPDPRGEPAAVPAPAPAAAPAHGPASVPEPDPAADVPTGDTATGTRRARTRLRVETESLPSADPVSPPREARVPSDAAHELYRPRADEAIRVARSAPPARADDAPDAADVRPHTARRSRGRGVVLLAVVVVVVVGAAVGLFLLMG